MSFRGRGSGSFSGGRGGEGRGFHRGSFGGGDRGGRGSFGGGDRGGRGSFGGGGGDRGFHNDGGDRGFRGGRGFGGGRGSNSGFNDGERSHNNNHSFHHRSSSSSSSSPQDIVIFLVNAGLYLGQDGLVDAYDRGMSTGVKNESVTSARPDIVHQCLLGIFDSELGASGRVRVFIYTTRGKTIEVSPHMRPPRTYDRFKGLMATVLRDGKVLPNADANANNNNNGYTSTGGAPLLQILQGTIAPIIPEGADVIGITNAKYANIATPLAVAQYCQKNPVSQQLRGGRKGTMAFFCIDCRDEADPSEEPSITKLVSLSPYPQAPHVQAIRLCEGFQFLNPEKYLDEKKQQYYENKAKEFNNNNHHHHHQHSAATATSSSTTGTNNNNALPKESGVRRQRE